LEPYADGRVPSGLVEALHHLRQAEANLRVLHVGAHPDDEHSALVAWMARGKGWRTVYLSATRGEGGQNAIGPERGDALGMIRTEELLAARELDGAEQAFLDLPDFGFSKSAEETLCRWDDAAGGSPIISFSLGSDPLPICEGIEPVSFESPRGAAARRLAKIIRLYRPHLIVSCFVGDASDGHGHHQAIGLMCHEAFRIAGDPDAVVYNPYSAVESEAKPAWQADALLASRWRPDPLADMVVDTGIYDPLYGATYFQIAARGRSRHRSQAMGMAEEPGSQKAWIRLLELAPRISRDEVLDHFKPVERDPGELARELGAGTMKGHWEEIAANPDGGNAARRSFAWALQVLHGPVVELLADEPATPWPALDPATRSRAMILKVTARGSRIELGEATFSPYDYFPAGEPSGERTYYLSSGEAERVSISHRDPVGLPMELDLDSRYQSLWPPDSPYFAQEELRKSEKSGEFRRTWKGWRGAARRVMPAAWVMVPWRIAGASNNSKDAGPWIITAVPAEHVDVSPTEGERRMPWRRYEAISGELENRIAFLRLGTDTETSLTLRWNAPEGIEFRHGSEGTTQALALALYYPRWLNVEPILTGESSPRMVGKPANIHWSPSVLTQRFENLGTKSTLRITPDPSVGSSRSNPSLVSGISFEYGAGPGLESLRNFLSTVEQIRYPHIPAIYYEKSLSGRVVTLSLRTPPALRLAYIPGPGDEVAPILRQVGVTVEEIAPGGLATADWSRFDTVMVGIRAFETVPELVAANARLLEWVRAGGTMVVQYQGYPFEGLGMAPYPFAFNRPHDRVTDERAPMTMLQPDHSLFLAPNKIGDGDFNLWVQERSLYEFGEFDEAHYTPLLSSFDPGEEPHRGLLLEAKVGRGRWIYCALSLFRQVPEGVPGGIRLAVNLAAAGLADREPAGE